MKLVSLNTWGGKMHRPLLEFFEKLSGEVDIFCLQEVFSTETEMEFSNGAKMNLYQDLRKLLPEYQSFYARKSHGYDYSGHIGADVDFGNVIFVKKEIPVLAHQEMFESVLHSSHDWKQTATAKAQLITIAPGGREISICNFHGLWKKDTFKKDIPERIEQSRQVRAALDALAHAKILCGDFNLLPDGESIKILEQGMRNLISDYGITSTRSSLYDKEMKFADYVLVSPEIEVQSFATLPDEVSDHLALELDFELNSAAHVAAGKKEEHGTRN